MCAPVGWWRYQDWLGCLFGGVSFGAGVWSFLLLHAQRSHGFKWMVPLLVWIATRAFFLRLEGAFSLVLRAAPKTGATQNDAPAPRGLDLMAPSGDPEWLGATPDGSLSWEYLPQGEMAMTAPLYGDVAFSNGVYVHGVLQEIVVANDGRFAYLQEATLQRTRHSYLLDFAARTLYVLDLYRSWEVVDIQESALWRNDGTRAAEIEQLIKSARAVPLIERGGRWVTH
jgi:hypothetical protein